MDNSKFSKSKFLPPTYVVRREGTVFTDVCVCQPGGGGVPASGPRSFLGDGGTPASGPRFFLKGYPLVLFQVLPGVPLGRQEVPLEQDRGYPRQTGQGIAPPPPPDRRASDATPWAVCLFQSCRRTFLLTLNLNY